MTANNKIQVKRTSTSGRVPNTTASYATNSQYIAAGELALNMADGILYSSNGSAVIEIGANNSSIKVGGVTTLNSVGIVSTANISGSTLFATNSGANEGGEIQLSLPSSGSTLTGPVLIDIYQNRIRFFEQGSSTRGAYIDLTACANGAGTNILTGGGGSASVNTDAQYTWSNNHTFQANVAFTGNNISVVSNTGSVMFGGAGDTNWRIGRSTGTTTKFYYTNNTLDIIAAASNLEGVVIGQPGGNTYLETGYAGTFTKNPIYVGNATVNVSINSTSFSGTANNASYLGGKAEAALNVNSALTSNNSTYAFGKSEAALNVNSALTSNNSAYLNGKAEAALNVNSALTANNSTYLGGKAEAALNVNSALTSNNSTYAFGKNQIDLNVNNALTANLASYVVANSGIVSNATGVYVNTSYIATLSANNTTYVNGKTEVNLNVNNALTSNNTTYVNGKTEGNLNVNSALTSNNTTYVNGKTEGNLNVNNALTANLASYVVANSGIVSNATGVYVNTSYIATLTANNTTYVNGKVESALNVNSALTSNNSTYAFGKSESALNVNSALTANSTTYVLANSGIVSNSFGVFVNTAYIATLSANNTTYVNGKTEGNLNVNSALTSNNTTYVNGKTEGNLNVNSAIYSTNSVNANNADYLDGQHGAYYAANSQLVNYALLSGAVFTGNVTANNANTTYDLNVGRNLVVAGNLTINGTVTTVGANNLTIVDNFIYINANNSAQNIDIGIAGNYNDGTYHHTGIFRDATDGYWKVFDNYAPEPDANVNIDTSNNTFHLADFWANTARFGNTTVYSTINTTSFSGTSNNSTYAFGKTEINLNVNSAVTSNTANNTTYVNGKAESALNVNSALTSNSTTYVLANTGIVSNATGVYVNAAYIATISANNTTYVNGKTEGNLNVNSAVTSNTANNASYLGTVAAANYVQNTDSRTLSGNLYFTGANVYYGSGLFVGANVVANATTLFVGNTTVNTSITAGQVTVNGQVLTTNNYLTTNYTTNSTIYSTFAQNTSVYSTFAQNTSVYSTFAQNTSVYSTFAQNTSVYSTFAQNTSVYSTFAQNNAVYANFAQLAANNTLSGNQYFQGTNNYFTAGLFVGANVSVNTTAIKYGPTTRDGFSNTTTGTTSQIVDSWPVATYRSAKYTLSVKDNNANAFMLSEMLVIFDSVNPQTTEYGLIISNTTLGTFSANSNTTHVRLTFTPTSTNTTIKADRLLITT